MNQNQRTARRGNTSGRVKEIGIVLMCGTQGCCPTVDFTDPQSVLIQDDFGGKVTLTREQWAGFKAKFVDSND
jgi:hypothetical protein